MEHISKELALWFKERGCEIPNTHWYVECGNGVDPRIEGAGYALEWKLMNESGLNNAMEAEERSPDFFPEGMYFNDSIPAYSWYDILVTHSKEFWGESPESIAETEAFKWWPMLLVPMLQEERYVAAEKLVREHSLFANS